MEAKQKMNNNQNLCAKKADDYFPRISNNQQNKGYQKILSMQRSATFNPGTAQTKFQRIPSDTAEQDHNKNKESTTTTTTTSAVLNKTNKLPVPDNDNNGGKSRNDFDGIDDSVHLIGTTTIMFNNPTTKFMTQKSNSFDHMQKSNSFDHMVSNVENVSRSALKHDESTTSANTMSTLNQTNKLAIEMQIPATKNASRDNSPMNHGPSSRVISDEVVERVELKKSEGYQICKLCGRSFKNVDDANVEEQSNINGKCKNCRKDDQKIDKPPQYQNQNQNQNSKNEPTISTPQNSKQSASQKDDHHPAISTSQKNDQKQTNAGNNTKEEDDNASSSCWCC